MDYHLKEFEIQEHMRRILGNTAKPERQVWLANWKKFGIERTSIYVISTDNSWPCKIGVSNYGYKRMCDLQVSVWRTLKVDYSAFAPSRAEAFRLEKEIHAELADKWLNGEWFDMRPNEVIDLIKFKACVMGIEIGDVVENPEIVADIKTKMLHLARIGVLFPQNAD